MCLLLILSNKLDLNQETRFTIIYIVTKTVNIVSGAATLSITTFSITILSIKELDATFSITIFSITTLSNNTTIMLNVAFYLLLC